MHKAAFWLRSFQFSCDTLDVNWFKKHQVEYRKDGRMVYVGERNKKDSGEATLTLWALEGKLRRLREQARCCNIEVRERQSFFNLLWRVFVGSFSIAGRGVVQCTDRQRKRRFSCCLPVGTFRNLKDSRHTSDIRFRNDEILHRVENLSWGLFQQTACVVFEPR